MKAILNRDFLALILSVAVVGLGTGATLPLTALALTSFAAGNSYFYLSSHLSLALFPSPADLGFLLFYPLLIAAVALAVRREVREFTALV